MAQTKLAKRVLYATPEWFEALVRLVAASGARNQAELIERAVEWLASTTDVTMPPRCKPLGYNQFADKPPGADRGAE